jgi:hypothetical protein
VILEERVELGAEFAIELTAEPGFEGVRRGRVVWVQEELDGAIVGIEFIGGAPGSTASTA